MYQSTNTFPQHLIRPSQPLEHNLPCQIHYNNPKRNLNLPFRILLHVNQPFSLFPLVVSAVGTTPHILTGLADASRRRRIPGPNEV